MFAYFLNLLYNLEVKKEGIICTVFKMTIVN